MIDRYVIYVCMAPRDWVTDIKVFLKRQHQFETGRATPHWPTDGGTFPAKPRTYGSPLPFPTYDVMASQVRVLAERLGDGDYRHVRRLVGYTQ